MSRCRGLKLGGWNVAEMRRRSYFCLLANGLKVLKACLITFQKQKPWQGIDWRNTGVLIAETFCLPAFQSVTGSTRSYTLFRYLQFPGFDVRPIQVLFLGNQCCLRPFPPVLLLTKPFFEDSILNIIVPPTTVRGCSSCSWWHKPVVLH